MEAGKTLGIPVTVYCQQNVSEHKKNVLLNKGVRVVLHGVDCVEAENEGRASAEVRVVKIRYESETQLKDVGHPKQFVYNYLLMCNIAKTHISHTIVVCNQLHFCIIYKSLLENSMGKHYSKTEILQNHRFIDAFNVLLTDTH